MEILPYLFLFVTFFIVTGVSPAKLCANGRSYGIERFGKNVLLKVKLFCYVKCSLPSAVCYKFICCVHALLSDVVNNLYKNITQHINNNRILPPLNCR